MTRPQLFSGSIPLREFGLWLLIVLCIQYWAGTAVLLAQSPGILAMGEAFTQVSVLPVVEWYAVFNMIRGFDDRPFSNGLAFGSLALIAIVSAAVAHQRFAFPVEAFLLILLWVRMPDLRRVGIVLVLIAIQTGRGMGFIHGWVSALDARIVGLSMNLIGQPVARTGNLLRSAGIPEGLMVLPGCASTYLMIPTGLGLTALLLAGRKRLALADYGWIGAVLAIAMVMNWLRLALMLRSHEAYESWHEGTGASLVSAAGLVVTMLCWVVRTGQTRLAS